MNKELSLDEVYDVVGNHKAILIEPKNRDRVLDKILVCTKKGINKGVQSYIIFYETHRDIQIRSGHWVAMVINHKNKIIYWFDSLGIFPDDELDFISGKTKAQTAQSGRTYGKFLYKMTKLGYKVNYNNLKVQKNKRGINTCGRYVGLYIRMNKNGDLTPEDFIDYLMDYIDKNNNSFDKVITYLTNEYI